MSTIERGRLIPQFSLPNSHSREVQVWDYRGRFNLVLLLTSGSASPAMIQLIEDLRKRREDLVVQEARVLAIVQSAAPELDRILRGESPHFEMLLDMNSEVSRRFDGHSACVTDRWGEIYAVWPNETQQTLPTVAEIMKELDFINRQCPECFPPEWPV